MGLTLHQHIDLKNIPKGLLPLVPTSLTKTGSDLVTSPQGSMLLVALSVGDLLID